jgi:hypothetical protein
MSEELNNVNTNEEQPEVNDKPTAEEPAKETEQSKTFTQEELDKILADRIARERKKLDKYADYDDVKKKAEELERLEKERKEAEMSEVEKLQERLEELQKQAEEAEQTKSQTLESANKRLIKSEFKLVAKELGVRKEALDDAFTLSDLNGVEVDEDGNVVGVKEALENLKKAKSYLFGGQNYADPTPGQHEASRKESQDAMLKQLKDAEAKARKSGRIEDRIAYVELKKKLGL